jgi:hypothetical protein
VRRTSGRWKRLIAVPAVVLALLAAPVAAHAAFTYSAQKLQPVTAGVIKAPATATVKCERTGLLWWAQTVLTVTAYDSVTYANYYDVKIFTPTGALIHAADLSTAAGRTVAADRDPGTWKYEIRASYKVPGSTNTWTGLPLKGDVRCP